MPPRSLLVGEGVGSDQTSEECGASSEAHRSQLARRGARSLVGTSAGRDYRHLACELLGDVKAAGQHCVQHYLSTRHGQTTVGRLASPADRPTLETVACQTTSTSRFEVAGTEYPFGFGLPGAHHIM